MALTAKDAVGMALTVKDAVDMEIRQIFGWSSAHESGGIYIYTYE